LRPSAFAVLRLITRSILVGDCTGRSASVAAAGFLESYNHPRRLNHRIGKMVLSTINAKPN
jgi:hypothetical protein